MASIQAASLLAPSPRRAASPLSTLASPLTTSDPAYVCRARRTPPMRLFSDGVDVYRAGECMQTNAHCRSPRDVPSRLLSPIRLHDRRARPTCFSSTSPSCSSPTPKRRRTHLRGPIRHRHCKQPDCPIVRAGLSVFDSLPWISMADQPSVVELIQPMNLADSSDLSPERPTCPTKSTGPIRSRKSSLRSAPFPSDVTSSLLSSLELDPSLPSNSPLLELPFARARRLSFGDDRPSTPPPRASVRLAEMDFRHLMPVTLSDVDGSERRWQSDCFSP